MSIPFGQYPISISSSSIPKKNKPFIFAKKQQRTSTCTTNPTQLISDSWTTRPELEGHQILPFRPPEIASLAGFTWKFGMADREMASGEGWRLFFGKRKRDPHQKRSHTNLFKIYRMNL